MKRATLTRSSNLLDGALLVIAALAGAMLWVALASIDVEETHEVGNDADSFRVVAALSIATIVVTLAVVFLRRPFRRLRAETRREAELEQLYEESQRTG